jgi:hypothetical protein
VPERDPILIFNDKELLVLSNVAEHLYKAGIYIVWGRNGTNHPTENVRVGLGKQALIAVEVRFRHRAEMGIRESAEKEVHLLHAAPPTAIEKPLAPQYQVIGRGIVHN